MMATSQVINMIHQYKFSKKLIPFMVFLFNSIPRYAIDLMPDCKKDNDGTLKLFISAS